MKELGLLSGASRREVAKGLWDAWQEHGASSAVLVGFSGTGKTERLVRPLVSHAYAELGLPTVHIDVPAQPTQLDQEMLSRLVEDLRDQGGTDLADEAASAPNFTEGVRAVLRQGGLVVIDEFQRLLHPDRALPVDPYAEKLRKLARRQKDRGCLWLVSNRSVDPEWTEPFHTAFLEPPGEIPDVIGIIVEALGTEDAASHLPEDRHDEIAQRFGRNPRALRLLGHLMRNHALEELIGPPQAADEGLSLEDLAQRIERSLLMRAREGLSNAAAEFLRDLSILPEPAPMGLLEALGAHLGETPSLVTELQERFLVEQRRRLRQVHPLVREVELPRLARDPATAAAAHRRVGAWHAEELARAVAHEDDTAVAQALGGVRHHFAAAGARDEFAAALDVARPYVERRFHWACRSPSTEAERDAQISLLELFLEEPGAPSVEYQLARRLEMRGEDDDLARALDHAARATIEQDFSDPWVLRLQLAHRIHGPEAAVAIGPEAIAEVDRGKSIFTVYQVYAAALNHLGQDDDSIATLLEGARTELSIRGRARLLDHALALAAAMPDESRLEEVRAWASEVGGFQPQVSLAGVLLDEHSGDWQAGAERARIGRRQDPTYLHLALHEAFCWLAADIPDEAQQALDRFPIPWRFEARSGLSWLAAIIPLRTDNLALGHRLAEIYLDGPLSKDSAAIERALIREWDTRVATLSEPNPALEFPILPPALSGLSEPVIRPQHGPPVLPQHAPGGYHATNAAEAQMRVLAVGTEWASGHGGLSTFNRQLCIALAGTGADVSCLAIEPTAAEIAEAGTQRVRLVAARPTPGEDERQWLSRRPKDLDPDYRPTIVIGHGRVTGPAAARLAEDVFPGAQRLHFIHMAPDEIEWHKFDRDDPPENAVSAAVQADERTQIELDLTKGAARTIAVGPRLYKRFVRELAPYGCPEPLQFNPGFDPPPAEERQPPGGEPWKVLLLGRAEDEKLKGLDIAASAIGKVASRRRGKGLPDLELVVRGAKPEDADALRDKIRGWAGVPLNITVRPYTTNAMTLERDMRTSSLVLMPSRSEGFGLVGLEAIVAGAPVLVTSRSGLAELLRDKLEAEEVARIIVPTTGDDWNTDDDRDEWARAIEVILSDRNAAFRNASDLAKHLGKRLTWSNAVRRLLSSLVEAEAPRAATAAEE